MTVLMCTRDLWRALGGKGSLAKAEQTPPSAASRLGDWSATLVALRRRTYVLALNERTYMAAVLPYVPLVDIPRQLALAAEWQLLQFGVPFEQALAESRAPLDLRFAANRNRSLIGSVNDLAFLSSVYVEEDRAVDVHRLQLWLNEVPHVKQEPCFAEQRVALLFADQAH